MSTNNHYDVIVLGAGAAGLFCASIIGQSGLKVLVLEKSNKPGKKILMSGGGRCNFTNTYSNPENFLSANPHFCKSALSRYTPWHFIELIDKHNIAYHEKELGQLFCDRSSKDILNMLLDECADGRVEIKLNSNVISCDFKQGIIVETEDKKFTANHLVVATGGLSIPKMGGSGYGYQLAEQLGLKVLPKRAGLVPLVFTDNYKKLFSELSGSSLEVEVNAPTNSDAPNFKHQMLFTHRGLSGPSMLQISSYWEEGKAIHINLLPDIGDVFGALVLAKETTPKLTISQWLSKHWPNKVAQKYMQFIYSSIHEFPLQNLSHSNMQLISENLSNWKLKPSGTEGYRTAEVTLGGIDTTQLSSKTMSSKQHRNVFFIGEVVDVTGHLGGHNFQWAWASGYAAAQALVQGTKD